MQQWQKSSFSTERSFLYRKMAGQWACNDHVERKGYLSMIAVYPDMQGKGCGKELLTYVEHTAKDCGMRTVWLEVSKANGSARSFYRKNGYVPVEMRPESMICAKMLENASDEWTEDTHDV